MKSDRDCYGTIRYGYYCKPYQSNFLKCLPLALIELTASTKLPGLFWLIQDKIAGGGTIKKPKII